MLLTVTLRPYFRKFADKYLSFVASLSNKILNFTEACKNEITTLALYGHGSETIQLFSMGHGKVIHFPLMIWFYKHFL